MKNIIENNRLIDAFMGNNSIKINVPFEYERGETLFISDAICATIEDAEYELGQELDNGGVNSGTVYTDVLNYHTHWEMLMLVVEKIESLVFEDDVYYNFNILSTCYVTIIDSKINEFGSYSGSSKLLAVHKAVVEFIEWYNQNK